MERILFNILCHFHRIPPNHYFSMFLKIMMCCNVYYKEFKTFNLVRNLDLEVVPTRVITNIC